jgi:hypothetical protein
MGTIPMAESIGQVPSIAPRVVVALDGPRTLPVISGSLPHSEDDELRLVQQRDLDEVIQ